jgi:DNA polymerase III subunit epsilon
MQTGIAGCIDVETTGLNPQHDEVVEMAIVLFSYCPDSITGIVDTYSGLREPRVPISESAYSAHGLSGNDLKDKRLDEQRVETMIRQADFLVSHNTEFDRSFTLTIFPFTAGKQWYCSMSGINWSGGKSLQKLLADHSIDPGLAHRALDDARAVISLLSHRASSGRTYFAEMIGS